MDWKQEQEEKKKAAIASFTADEAALWEHYRNPQMYFQDPRVVLSLTEVQYEALIARCVAKIAAAYGCDDEAALYILSPVLRSKEALQRTQQRVQPTKYSLPEWVRR